MPKIYFNTNLEYLRKRKGWTQTELANKLGTGSSTSMLWYFTIPHTLGLLLTLCYIK